MSAATATYPMRPAPDLGRPLWIAGLPHPDLTRPPVSPIDQAVEAMDRFAAEMAESDRAALDRDLADIEGFASTLEPTRDREEPSTMAVPALTLTGLNPFGRPKPLDPETSYPCLRCGALIPAFAKRRPHTCPACKHVNAPTPASTQFAQEGAIGGIPVVFLDRAADRLDAARPESEEPLMLHDATDYARLRGLGQRFLDDLDRRNFARSARPWIVALAEADGPID